MTKERFNMLVGSIGAFIGVFVFFDIIKERSTICQILSLLQNY